MALQSSHSLWNTFFADAGIPPVEAETYAQKFVENRINDPLDLTVDLLKELGVTSR